MKMLSMSSKVHPIYDVGDNLFHVLPYTVMATLGLSPFEIW